MPRLSTVLHLPPLQNTQATFEPLPPGVTRLTNSRSNHRERARKHLFLASPCCTWCAISTTEMKADATPSPTTATLDHLLISHRREVSELSEVTLACQACNQLRERLYFASMRTLPLPPSQTRELHEALLAYFERNAAAEEDGRIVAGRARVGGEVNHALANLSATSQVLSWPEVAGLTPHQLTALEARIHLQEELLSPSRRLAGHRQVSGRATLDRNSGEVISSLGLQARLLNSTGAVRANRAIMKRCGLV